MYSFKIILLSTIGVKVLLLDIVSVKLLSCYVCVTCNCVCFSVLQCYSRHNIVICSGSKPVG